MIIRLRSRDGLERVEVPDHATVADLKSAINSKLQIPIEDMLLSLDPKLLTTKGDAEAEFKDMINNASPLTSLGITHGAMIHLLYHFERQVEGVKLSEFDKRPFGPHMTVSSMVAKQTRIERQETPTCASVSFDMHAANAFQSYVQSALAFSIKRGGILYGTIDEEEGGGGGGGVFVHAIYEPPQDGSPDSLVLHRGTEEEQRADAVAAAFGWTKVGWIFTQSTKEREFICSAEEICQMAAIQSEMGDKAVTALVAMFPPDEEGAAPEVHFEAFQVSAQCVKLWEEGWFNVNSASAYDASGNNDIGENNPSTKGGTLGRIRGNGGKSTPDPSGEPSATIPVQNPKDPADKSPIIVAGKDVGEIDADYFLVPVGIKDHEGPVGSSFAIENRFLPQGAAELKSHLQGTSARPYAERLSDFHLLLYVAKQPGLEVEDVAALVAAVANKEPVPEGYKIIIDSIAGI